MHSHSYESRLSLFGTESLESRRVKADLVHRYKILFKHVDVDAAEFFSVIGCNRVGDGSVGHGSVGADPWPIIFSIFGTYSVALSIILEGYKNNLI